MNLNIGNSINYNNCTYKIQQKLSDACYVANLMLTGDLGALDSNESFLLTNNSESVKSFQRKKKDAIVDVFSLSGEQIYVFPDSSKNREIILSTQQTQTQQLNLNIYEGQKWNGLPHGTGTMIYGDGKKYTGEFRYGKRHGHGVLIMPNGESFEGQFENDSITENGIYYDENGKPRYTKIHKKKSFGNLLWEKTWRLLVSAICFALAGLTIWLITTFLTSGKGGIVRVGVFIAPLAFAWWGLKSLIGFFSNLIPTKN